MKKMKKRSNGFTLTELAIVIAVIAILIAVLVPTFTSLINKAQESSDSQLVKNLNTALSVDEATNDKANTMSEALAVAAENGYNVDKLTPASSGDIVWDQESNRFLLINEDGEIVYSDSTTSSDVLSTKYQLWYIAQNESDVEKGTYSYYINYETTSVNAKYGVDVGDNTDVAVTITGDSGVNATIIVNTNGGTLTVDAESYNVNHYGAAGKVVVTAVADNSYHVYGTVIGNIEATKGRIVIEEGANATNVYIKSTDVKIVNNSSNTINAVPATDDVKNSLSSIIESGKADTSTPVISSTLLSSFAGGFGTEDSPFQISTAQQFKNIYVISQDCVSNSSETYGYDANNLVYYELLNDVTLTEYYSISSYSLNTFYLAYAIFDGNGYTLDGADSTDNTYSTYLFYSISWGSTFRNVTVNLGGKTKAIAVNIADNSTLEDVTVTGRVNYEANNGVLSTYAWGTLTFTNCVNQATMIGKGYSTSYNGVFIGCNGGNNVDFTFNSCKNEGTLVCGQTALFMGNFYGTYATECSMTINNCSNSGIIRSVYVDSSYSPNYYLAIGYTSSSVSYNVTVNGSAYSSFATAATEHAIANASNEPYDTATLTANSDNYFVITQSKYSDVDYYEITVGLYVNLYSYDSDGNIKKDTSGNYVSGGTSRYYITLTVDADLVSADGYVSALQKLTFIDLATYLSDVGKESFEDMKNDSTVTAVGDGYMVYDSVKVQYYYLVNNSAVYFSSGTGTPTVFAVSMYDSDGYLISSVNG